MAIYAVAGASIAIGQPLAAKDTDFIESDFDGQSWVNINWAENLGSFGDEAAEITFDSIGQGRTQKLKGNRNAGNMELVLGYDYEDDGQTTLRGAETEDSDYAFRVLFDDAPSGGSATTRYFIAKVMSAREQLDSANNVIRINAILAINSNVVQVDASA